MRPRLSCGNGGAKRRRIALRAIFCRKPLCHLGVTSSGCFNHVAPRFAAAAMLTEWVAMGEATCRPHGPTHRDNHAALKDAFSYRRTRRGDAFCRRADVRPECGAKGRGEG